MTSVQPNGKIILLRKIHDKESDSTELQDREYGKNMLKYNLFSRLKNETFEYIANKAT